MQAPFVAGVVSLALLSCAACPSPVVVDAPTPAGLRGTGAARGGDAGWDGSMPGRGGCNERVAGWSQRLTPYHPDGTRLAVREPRDLVQSDEGGPVPSFLMVELRGDRISLGDDAFGGDAVRAVEALVRVRDRALARERWAGVLLDSDAHAPTLFKLLAAIRGAGLRSFVAVARLGSPVVRPSARVQAALAGANGPSAEATSLAAAWDDASRGCTRSAALLGSLASTPPSRQGARFAAGLVDALKVDECACDVDALFELAAFLFAGQVELVSKEVSVAASEPTAQRTLSHSDAAKLYAAFPGDASPVWLNGR